ncbi:hypothetical protein BJX96DRAFT_186231 [Aspergillus floccosus]
MLETKAKGECDRLLPVCTACVEAKAKCCPRSIPSGPAAEDASALSNAALPDYVESLKRKAEDLEDLTRRQRLRLASEGAATSLSHANPADETQGSPQISHPTPLSEQSSLTERSVQAAMGEIGFLSRNAMAEPRDQASGFPQELAIGSMIRASLAISGSDPTQSLPHSSQKSRYMAMVQQAPEVSRDFMTECLDRLFERTKTICPYLNEGEMIDCCDAFFHPNESAKDLNIVFRDFNVYMTAAIGTFLSLESGAELFSSNLHTTAMQRFPSILDCNDDVKVLHSILLLIIYSMFTSTGGSTWHLLGLAMKKAISYRFNKEPLPDSGVSEDKVEQRRRIFWNLYIIDRAVSCALDRPFSIEDGDISLRLPSDVESCPSESLHFRAHVLMHARLMSNIRGSPATRPIFHYGALCYWRDIPKGVKSSSQPSSTIRAVRNLTCRALVYMARTSSLGQMTTSIFGPTQSIQQDVMAACREYINGEYDASENGNFSGSFIDAFDIFAAGVVFSILGRSSSFSGSPSEGSVLSRCTALLTILGERFSGLKSLCKVLWRLQESTDDTMSPSRADDLLSTGQPASPHKPTVYVLDKFPPKAIEHAKTLFNIIQPHDEAFQHWRANARALLIRSSYLTAEDIASCPSLIAIGKHGVGIDKIDQDACAKRGIKILNTPGANARDVAELVVTLALSVARGIRSITTRQMLKPVPKETCNGLTLYQKTIGIIGMGNIGRTVAEIFQAGFAADIVAYDAYMPDNVWPHIPHVRARNIEEVLLQADILSVHVPLTKDTRDMITYDRIRTMKSDAILINAARGGIVNEQDLTRALSEGYLWGAGLDCHEQEPPSHEKYGLLWENLNLSGFDGHCPGYSFAMPLHVLHIALHAIRDEECFPIFTSKCTVGQIPPTTGCRHDPCLRNAVCINHKNRPQTRMTDEQIAFLIHGQTIGTRTSERLKEYSNLGSTRSPFIVYVGPSRKISEVGSADPLRHSDRLRYGMGLIAETKKAIQDAPKGMFNAYVLMCTCVFAFAGVAKGFDEDEYANTKGWIVSITTAGAVFGCLGCPRINDGLGRRWNLRLSTVLYMAGILGQGLCNGNLSGLYASRFIAGLGMGVLTIVPPIYITEIAPKMIRGLLTLQYAACQQLGVVFGFFINYGVTKSYHGGDKQWMIPTLLQLLPAAIWLLGSFLCCESPRWLLYKGKRNQAATTMSKLRHLPLDHPIVVAELAGMDAQLLLETESTKGASLWDLLKETLVPVENRRRFFLIFMATLLSQWSGANAITQYSPTIFGYLGIVGDESKFLATGIYGVVKFVSTLAFALFIVDFIGRRRSLMTGICLQLVTLIFVGAYLGATKDMTPEHIHDTPSASRASMAAIVAIYLHATAWSIGWFSIPYLVGSEIFPIRIRSLNVSISMAFHWAFYFGCSRAMPSLLAATDKWGAFVFFGCICLISLIYVFFAMPDTTGRSLEALDSLFQRPWYTVHEVAYPSRDAIQVERYDAKTTAGPRAEHVETA